MADRTEHIKQAMIDGVCAGVQKKIKDMFPDITKEEIQDTYSDAIEALDTIDDAFNPPPAEDDDG